MATAAQTLARFNRMKPEHIIGEGIKPRAARYRFNHYGHQE